MNPTVALIDDDRAVLASLEALFVTAGYDVRAFESAADFLGALKDTPPTCVVTDLEMPGMGGLALIKRLRTELMLDWPVVVISGHADVAKAVEAMQAGALDFLVKPFPPRKLLEVVGRALLPSVNAAVEEASEYDIRYLSLTSREQQVAELLVSGASSKSAGLELGISPRTVDVFRGKIAKKMGVSNIAALSTAIASVTVRLRADGS